jgi:glycosyltransferase involved in cell wall biosynthesis
VLLNQLKPFYLVQGSDEPMKFIYLHQYFNTPEMSGGTRSFEMARRMVAAGHEVHMITSWRDSYGDKKWFESQVAGIHVHWLPVEYSNNMSFSARIMAFFIFALRSAIKASQIRADLVFATSTPLTIALPAVFAAKKLKIPMVFEVRDLWPELPIAMGALKNPIARYFASKLESLAYKNASAVIALSPGMKEGVVRTGYASSKVAVIPNSSDIDMFQVNHDEGKLFRKKRKWLGDKPLLIYTGTFGLINGVGYLVDLAVELLRLDSDIRILAIGGGAEFDDVSQSAHDSGVLNKNLFIEDYLKKKEIPAALNAATMACALFIDKPEMRSNSANKFFDALAAGKPVMINYGGWMHKLVNTHGCGISMWQKTIEEVALELNEVTHDKYWLESASISSINLAKAYFDRDILASQLMSVLKETAEGRTEKVERLAPGIY